MFLGLTLIALIMHQPQQLFQHMPTLRECTNTNNHLEFSPSFGRWCFMTLVMDEDSTEQFQLFFFARVGENYMRAHHHSVSTSPFGSSPSVRAASVGLADLFFFF